MSVFVRQVRMQDVSGVQCDNTIQYNAIPDWNRVVARYLSHLQLFLISQQTLTVLIHTVPAVACFG